MRKFGSILIIFFFVVVAYIFMMVMQPAVNAMVETANSSANWTNYPETQAVLVGWPFWSYLLPVVIGGVAVVIVLKSGDK